MTSQSFLKGQIIVSFYSDNSTRFEALVSDTEAQDKLKRWHSKGYIQPIYIDSGGIGFDSETSLSYVTDQWRFSPAFREKKKR